MLARVPSSNELVKLANLTSCTSASEQDDDEDDATSESTFTLVSDTEGVASHEELPGQPSRARSGSSSKSFTSLVESPSRRHASSEQIIKSKPVVSDPGALRRCSCTFRQELGHELLVVVHRLINVFETAAHFYVIWVLFGVICFVTHLGDDLPEIAFLLPGGGAALTDDGRDAHVEASRFLPANPTDGGPPGDVHAGARRPSAHDVQYLDRAPHHQILDYFFHNVPYALFFVFPHSFLKHTLRHKLGLFWYNFHAAVSLHVFLANYRKLDGPVFQLLELPISNGTHLWLVLPVIAASFWIFLMDEKTQWMLFPKVREHAGVTGSMLQRWGVSSSSASAPSAPYDKTRLATGQAGRLIFEMNLNEENLGCKASHEKSAENWRQGEGEGDGSANTCHLSTARAGVSARTSCISVGPPARQTATTCPFASPFSSGEKETRREKSDGGSGTARATSTTNNKLDIITAMAESVVRSRFGVLGFILFSGLSIIPRKMTVDDLILRICAAVYLRIFSKAFRAFSRKIANTHLVIWMLRGTLVLLTVFYCGAKVNANIGAPAAALTSPNHTSVSSDFHASHLHFYDFALGKVQHDAADWSFSSLSTFMRIYHEFDFGHDVRVVSLTGLGIATGLLMIRLDKIR
ncbi:unnamed protein product [Amoebophrya sp. A120]|nr:unnamed protein product [Amoebophrya sp. A120]|eukprot:GSA120T00010540001.1